MNPFPPTMNMAPKQLIPNPELKQPQTSEHVLYVGNLPPSIEDTLLYEIFRPYGKVVFAKVRKDVFSSDSRGYGFVSYETKQEAENAIKELRYKEFQGQELKIFFKKQNQDFNTDANIFFKNLPLNFKAKELHSICSPFGNVLSCQIKKDDKGKGLGYAYVQFEKPEEAEKAIKALNEKQIGENVVTVAKFVSSKMRRVEQKNIYIKQFPKKWNKAQVEGLIKKKFHALGEIESEAIFDKEIDGKVQYFAFLAYKQKESADEAIKLNNIKLEEDAEPLYVGFAESKKKRKEKFKKQTVPFD